jgi:ribosome biogenesis GTPase
MTKGIIVKGIGGFYYVDTPEGMLECKAPGRFRIRTGKPFVGDIVETERNADGTGVLTAIFPRKNTLIRPPVSNLDQIVVVASLAPPVTDTFLVDKITAIAEHKGMDVLLVVNKIDACAGQRLYDIYRRAGFPVICASARTGEGIEEIKARLEGKVSAFAGNSGVGKSSILNRIDQRFQMEVGEISAKISRGKHTTRHVELLKLPGGGYIADTPGFSSFETGQMDLVLKDDLQYAFREFAPYLGTCRFTGCSHTKEKDCAVLAAAARGEISTERLESYRRLYESVRDIKEWELK